MSEDTQELEEMMEQEAQAESQEEPQEAETQEPSTPEESGEAEESAEAQSGELDELWSLAVPELAPAVGELSDQAKIRFLLQRLAANSAREPTNADASETGVGSETGQNRSTPPVEVPDFDPAEYRPALVEQFDDEGADAIMNALNPSVERVNRLGMLVVNALQEMSAKIDGPRVLESAKAKVQGATAEDVLEARRLLESGEVKKPELAIQFAMLSRTARKGQKPASESARRRARSLNASRATGSNLRDTGAPKGIPTSQADLEALVEEMEADK